MKIMFATDEPSIESQIAERFARAAYFVVYDDKSGKHSVIENDASAAHGMASKAVQIAIDNGASVLISAIPGENAMEALRNAGIDVYEGKGLAISEAIKKFKSGELKKI